jgi:hypothetical protein
MYKCQVLWASQEVKISRRDVVAGADAERRYAEKESGRDGQPHHISLISVGNECPSFIYIYI